LRHIEFQHKARRHRSTGHASLKTLTASGAIDPTRDMKRSLFSAAEGASALRSGSLEIVMRPVNG
jgi:hypothetical protein